MSSPVKFLLIYNTMNCNFLVSNLGVPDSNGNFLYPMLEQYGVPLEDDIALSSPLTAVYDLNNDTVLVAVRNGNNGSVGVATLR